MCKVNICNIQYKMCTLKTSSFSKDLAHVIPRFINVDFKLYDAKIFNIIFIIRWWWWCLCIVGHVLASVFILLLFGCWFVLARMANPNNSIGGFSVFFCNFPLIYCPACSCIWEALQNYKRIRIKKIRTTMKRGEVELGLQWLLSLINSQTNPIQS